MGHYHYLFREILAGNISETSFAHHEQIVQRKKIPLSVSSMKNYDIHAFLDI